ncbi:MAG: hypothetical protein CMG46_05490 [Candidatus Marinimicrobia bacterium]|nr:hypothetical protein [Candidatus Neomarinimicrobiota bacterium]
MPLPPPNIKRKHVHTRTITCKGFERTDGSWEVEGWITDVKTYGVNSSERIHVPAGEPMHGMGMRLTVDDNLQVSDVIAIQDYSPYRICHTITPNFRKLIGLSLKKGFRKSVRKLLGGTKGCVHLVDILGPMATTLFQSQTKQRSKQFEKARSLGEQLKPPVLNTCHAWSSNSSVVKKSFPDFYTGK